MSGKKHAQKKKPFVGKFAEEYGNIIQYMWMRFWGYLNFSR